MCSHEICLFGLEGLALLVSSIPSVFYPLPVITSMVFPNLWPAGSNENIHFLSQMSESILINPSIIKAHPSSLADPFLPLFLLSFFYFSSVLFLSFLPPFLNTFVFHPACIPSSLNCSLSLSPFLCPSLLPASPFLLLLLLFLLGGYVWPSFPGYTTASPLKWWDL